ncbi:DUF4255 domain-containing protein [uncultured Thalassolituus sp.]|uniref:DUF4255 domain-containing protein n=1 Tax=uncultured Thalassolituus sp. TaxID=285273 RepID=UPI002609AD27|nr:DUF4255 domain-containing protein [uncultured Thalassolituus sp.]
MASYKGVQGVLRALEAFFKSRLPDDLSDGPTNAKVEILGSSDIANRLTGNMLGIYLHRITIDEHGRSRYFAPRGNDLSDTSAELPLNLHFLLIANAGSAAIEADLMSWAMVELANHSQFDISHLQASDAGWGENEVLTITPEDTTTEDLMRIWDVFESPYTSTMAYVAKTVRLRLQPQRTEGGVLVSRVLAGGSV